jgi:hypothetical protein
MARIGSKAAALVTVSIVALTGTGASAAGPGGWDHLGDAGTPGSDALNGPVRALHVNQGLLYVGGDFTGAGADANANRIAKWNGSSWSALSSLGTPATQIDNGGVSAIAVSAGKVYAGGTFQNAGGKADADFLAVWDGVSWAPFCNVTGPAFDGNVNALQIIGSTLYVGGSFHNAAGIASADYLVACSLTAGAPSTTIAGADLTDPFSGSVYAFTADGNGTLYAGGGFINLEDIPEADNIAYRDGTGWHAMGAGVDTFVRGLAAAGTDVYVGTDAKNVAGIPQADNVVKWNGSAWSAMGASTAGDTGWFPTTASINGLTTFGANVFATGSFLDANGDARADNIAFFDGTAWHPTGSDGAGNGPWNGTGLAVSIFNQRLYAGGSFTSAGGDAQAHSVTSFPLSQIIAVPTPTPTPSPGPMPTPTVTAGPAAVPTPTPTPTPDTTPPPTAVRKAAIRHGKRKATFQFASAEAGATFSCKLDSQKFKTCTSPKTYKHLKPGRHEFRVRARDGAGNADATPAVKKLRIKR